MDALWVVPAKPTIPNDVIQFVLWIGFQQNGQDIVQPELWYHSSRVRLHCGGVKLRDFASLMEFPT
jgi:hypothetical protein